VRDAGQKVFGDLTEAEEAQYEPFRKVLSGDKLILYNDRLKNYKLYGAGGRVLKTPEAYRDSTLWCTTGVDREGIVPVWSVDCWHFKGMTKVGAVESRTHQSHPGHYLNENPGEYEVRVLRDGKLTRVLKFTVGPDGKIVDNGIVNNNHVLGFRIVVPAQVLGDTDGQWDRNAWKTEMLYGNPLSGFVAP